MGNRTVLLVRHGTVDMREGFGVPTIYGPQEPLNDHGIRQSIRLAQRLSDMGIHPDVIYTSAYKRAHETARCLHDTLPHHPSVITDEQINGSRSPQWNYRPESELALANNNIFADNPCVPEVHGETLPQAYSRVTNEFKRLLKAHQEGTIAIVTHGEIIGMIKHYLAVGDRGTPGVDAAIENSEALFLRISPEGTLLETRIITPEGLGPRPEIRG